MKSWKVILVFLLLLTMSAIGFAKEGKIQLSWQNAENAVLYELEIDNVRLNSKQNATDDQIVYTTTEVYTPAIELDLSLLDGQKMRNLYYRVRPLDLNRKPIADFSAPVAISKGKMNPTKPTPTAFFTKNRPTALYPVYSWIPVLGAARYEVEITSQPPENPNGVTPSRYRIRSYSVDHGFDCYDTHAYTEAGTYYWRVLALDQDDQPIGTYSDALSFQVQPGPVKWAALGDSITHGGGAISNPPSDKRYEYLSYLPFTVKNLGKSGDTIEDIVERFDRDVLPFKPQYLFVLAGTNSLRAGESAESVISSLEEIISKCDENGITPIFLTVPPLNPDRIQRVFKESTTDDWQSQIAKVNEFIKKQPNAVDIYTALVDAKGILPEEYSQDGLHPDISGKRIIARCINDYLKKHNMR